MTKIEVENDNLTFKGYHFDWTVTKHENVFTFIVDDGESARASEIVDEADLRELHQKIGTLLGGDNEKNS